MRFASLVRDVDGAAVKARRALLHVLVRHTGPRIGEEALTAEDEGQALLNLGEMGEHDPAYAKHLANALEALEALHRAA